MIVLYIISVYINLLIIVLFIYRTLSETVKTLKTQMTDLQSQMSLLTKQLDEERRSRLSLAATVKRSMGVIDG